MIVMGLDPGIVNTGYAVINFKEKEPVVSDFGCIRTDSASDFSLRLKHIYDNLVWIIQQYKPHAMALEEVIYAKNVKIALKMGHARGVTLLAASNNGLTTSEYSPKEIKLAATGNGGASKQQVSRMVAQLLNLPQPPSSFDVTDAMAVAICHGYRKMKNQLYYK
ncbi:crossover junction endodeoxyribonuclease RuvC [candidate division KSB1 bacterium]|nr:crossover junction endodeoxyribonuclease RuvC [candidate division KSB1 bacterium]